MIQQARHRGDFRPFVEEAARRGIGRTKAYELVNAGLLETFLIGSKRYVFLESFDALPERLANIEVRAPAASRSRIQRAHRRVKA